MSGFYGYLKGVNNELADKYLPNVSPRNDSLAGPMGRKSDQVSKLTDHACQSEEPLASPASPLNCMNESQQCKQLNLDSD